MTDKPRTSSIVITREMWRELGAIAVPFLNAMENWSSRHDLPPPVVSGVMIGFSALLDSPHGTCDCPICGAVAGHVADAVVAHFACDDTDGGVH